VLVVAARLKVAARDGLAWCSSRKARAITEIPSAGIVRCSGPVYFVDVMVGSLPSSV